MEWAIGQPGVAVIREQQVANNWIRTYDMVDLEALHDGDDVVQLELPYRYCTSAVGGAGTPHVLMTDSLEEASSNQIQMINKTRQILGPIP